ncbi:MAG: CHAT domain-containing protein [Chloroflexota bacterium]
MNQNLYADVEIRILEEQSEGYPVEITVNGEQEFPRGYLSPDFLPWVAGASPQEDGQRLFEWLLADPQVRTAWAEVRGKHTQRRIRLRLDANVPELHALPWETIRDTDDTVPQDLAAVSATPFSRYLAGKWQPGSPILKRPIKILVAVANPDNLSEYDLAAIDADDEFNQLQEATAGLPVELVSVPQPCTLPAIEKALKEGCHILHFVGHGMFSKRSNEARLYLADDSNQVNLVSETDFSEMLARQLSDDDTLNNDKLRLVFLASCQTATRSNADAFRGFAPALIQAGVPAVLAMQDLVAIETAQAFSQTFYKQVLDHGLVDKASNEARSAILTAGLPGAAIPVLFMRIRNGTLLGIKGHFSSSDEKFWPFLLGRLDRGQVVPFLGPRVNDNLIASPLEIAQRLAERYSYPFEDRQSLFQIAQYIAIRDPEVLRQDYLRFMQRSLFGHLGLKPTKEEKKRFRRTGLSETVQALEWVTKVLDVQENQIHHLLADLELPLYISTNFDNFMSEALKHKGASARQYGPRWLPEAGSPQFVLTPRPSLDHPIVFHLNGFEGDQEQEDHLVLSEEDYLKHLVRLSRDQELVLPMNLLEALSQHSFVFLGYQLDDWEFRLILQGLLNNIAQTSSVAQANKGRKVHVGIQLEDNAANASPEAMSYLKEYLERFNIEIYWGTPQQFMTELHMHWQEYIFEDDDDW